MKKIIFLLLLSSISYAGVTNLSSELYDIYSLENTKNATFRVRENFYTLENKIVVNSVPAGSILPYISNTVIPSGYLYCNGQAVSRTAYPDLFNVIGTSFGGGDGSTTFNVPDMRGMFLRGLDDSRGFDTERYNVVGSTQADAMQGHYHNVRYALDAFTAGAINNGEPNTAGTNITGAVEGAITDGTHGTPRISSETRPMNISVVFIIKY